MLGPPVLVLAQIRIIFLCMLYLCIYFIFTKACEEESATQLYAIVLECTELWNIDMVSEVGRY